MMVDLFVLGMGVYYCTLGYHRYPRNRFLGVALVACGLLMGVGGISATLREARAFQYVLAASIILLIVTAAASGISWLRRYWDHRRGEIERLATLSASSSGVSNSATEGGKEGGRIVGRNGDTGV